MATEKPRMPVRMLQMHRIAQMFSAAANPMTQAMVRIYNARLAKEAEALAKQMEVQKASKAQARTWNPKLPPGLPPVTSSWRENFSRLGGDMAASPLPTRQLRRSTGRAMARMMASVGRIQERKARRIVNDPDYARAKGIGNA